jgi:hypothetical protein
MTDMTEPPRPARRRRLLGDTRGNVLVEFTFTLPVLLGLFVLLSEGGTLLWRHQLVTKSVRDATRYLSRVATADQLCPPGGGIGAVPGGFLTTARNLALRSALGTGRPPLIPTWTDSQSLQVSVACLDNSGGAYRGRPRLPLLTVSATVPVALPLAPAMALLGGSAAASLTFTVVDQTRHYGE